MLAPGAFLRWSAVSTSGRPGASFGCVERELELIDEIAIREFLHGDYPRLVAGVAMVAGSRPAAEDAVQEALARAWERSERGEEIESLTAWVTAVSLNLARSRLRRVVAERRARERWHRGLERRPWDRRTPGSASTCSAHWRRSPGDSERPRSSATTWG